VAQREDISGLDTMAQVAEAKSSVDDQPSDLPEVDHKHYDVVGEHGRGGMGRVLVGWDRRLARPVAIKELLSSRSDARARFVREAMVTARLQHPSIVPVHEAGRWPTGEPFYTMKLVQGRPLDAVMREKKTFAERLALLPVVIAVAEAVAYAHSRRVIHRDLKPANVIVGDFGETILIDWGLAKELEQDQSSVQPSDQITIRDTPSPSYTMDGSVVGTPGFMSPEQAAGDSVDVRTDVYALGAMLYNLLCGEIPVRGRTPPELLQAVVDGRTVPIREREPLVPDELVDIVHKAMARRREERYESARDVAAELKRFSTGQLVSAHRYSLRELVRRWLWRHRVVVATAAAALVLVAGFGAFSVRRVVRERDRADHERNLALKAESRADQAREEEARRVDELVVAQARAVLDHDPTNAIAWLKRLRPGASRWEEAAPVALDAQRRGIAERVFIGHKGPAQALAASPDSEKLASGGVDGTARVWQIATGAPMVLGPGKGEITALQFLPDSRRLLAGDSQGRLQLWDLTTHVAVVLEGHSDRVTGLAVSGDGTRALSCGRDGTLHLWDLTKGEARGNVDVERPLVSLALSADGRTVAARLPGGLRRFDALTLSPLPLENPQLPGDGQVVFSSDGQLAAGGAGEVRLWDARGRARTLAADGMVSAVSFSPDARRLGGASDDGTVRWWELPSGAVHPLAHKGDASRELHFTNDGQRLLATRGETVRMWVLPGPDPRKLRGPAVEVLRALFTPDGARLATASADGVLRVYHMGPGVLPAEPPPPSEEAKLRPWLDLVTNAVVP
jgi:WD40 repeat protein